MSPSSPKGRRPAGARPNPKRGRASREPYKAPRDRAELGKAIAAAAIVVVLSVGAVVFLGRDEIWSDDPETPPATQLTIPTTTSGSTATTQPAAPSTTQPAAPAP
jgi:hypothetical protein